MADEMKHPFNKLQQRCQDYENPLDTLVAAWFWDGDGELIMIRITRDINTYTMTTAFMVNGSAHCSVDVQGGDAEDIFSKMAMRMLPVSSQFETA